MPCLASFSTHAQACLYSQSFPLYFVIDTSLPAVPKHPFHFLYRNNPKNVDDTNVNFVTK
ncbi:MAG: hypothetical protein KAU29_06970, partial [Gammaproteobacteria bacterium]|nr:hypothetical protein [Gammaproteobacteria bacterium]